MQDLAASIGPRTNPNEVKGQVAPFLCTKTGTAVARLSHCNSVCPSITRVSQSITLQARIIKSSTLAAWKTLVSGSMKLFHEVEKGHIERGC